MEAVILRPNAIPVYAFLSTIHARRDPADRSPPGVILDCGAGGPIPPVALFRSYGFEAWGIDTSEAQLDLARRFCREQNIDLNLRQGDMRQIPFEDHSFDFVYEHYVMCHLSTRDTALAISENHRVLRPGGLCFLGVISADTWPKTILGQEKEPGEFWGDEGGQETLHSLFTDDEADELVSGWEIVSSEKRIRILRRLAAETSLEDWKELQPGGADQLSREAWRARYDGRATLFQYAHLYFILSKAG